MSNKEIFFNAIAWTMQRLFTSEFTQGRFIFGTNLNMVVNAGVSRTSIMFIYPSSKATFSFTDVRETAVTVKVVNNICFFKGIDHRFHIWANSGFKANC